MTSVLEEVGGRLYHSETVGDGETSAPVLIRNASTGGTEIEQVVVAVICTTANKVQFTLDPPAVVEAGGATWIDWEAGEVTATTAATLPREVTAVRCDNTGASDSTFKVSA